MAKDEQIFDSLFERLKEENKNFPPEELKARLIALGIKDILDGHEVGDFGFPSRYIDHLDESTLALYYFMKRFKREGGSLKVYGIHRLKKGEDKTLASWINEQARLFIELQNMILLLNGQNGKTEIHRIFVLKDVADLAFFNQSAINVISEQVSLEIKIGFLFLNEFDVTKDDISVPWKRILSNSLIIEYEPKDHLDKQKPNFYFLYDIPRGRYNVMRGNNLRNPSPYTQRCLTKWARDAESVTFPGDDLLVSADHLHFYKSLFKEKWSSFKKTLIDFNCVLKMVDQDNAFFNNALLMMCRAFNVYNLKTENVYNTELYIQRVFENVITPDFMRLEKAMSAFDVSKVRQIRAVDSTSVKNTLNVHESEPRYRQWIRLSINRVFKSNAVLERIYIIDDQNPKKDEYPTLIRNLQYYLDYINFEIPELQDISILPDNEEAATDAADDVNQQERRSNLRGRIKIYVTTAQIIEQFADAIIDESAQQLLNEFQSDDINSANWVERLSRLDYLFTEEMIYDFNNPRGDPGELKFEAYLIRKKLNKIRESSEKKDLFNFDNIDYLAESDVIKVLRTYNFALSIDQYFEKYRKVKNENFTRIWSEKPSGDILKSLEKMLFRAPKKLTTDERRELEEYQEKLFSYRMDLENNLYNYLHPWAEFFFDALKVLSIEVDFFVDGKFDITDIEPFNRTDFDMNGLSREISRQAQVEINKVGEMFKERARSLSGQTSEEEK